MCVNDIIKGGYFVLRESISMRNLPEMWVLILIKVAVHTEGGSKKRAEETLGTDCES